LRNQGIPESITNCVIIQFVILLVGELSPEEEVDRDKGRSRGAEDSEPAVRVGSDHGLTVGRPDGFYNFKCLIELERKDELLLEDILQESASGACADEGDLWGGGR
jgi:hypothetical protein